LGGCQGAFGHPFRGGGVQFEAEGADEVEDGVKGAEQSAVSGRALGLGAWTRKKK